jgi:hypothetical protein
MVCFVVPHTRTPTASCPGEGGEVRGCVASDEAGRTRQLERRRFMKHRRRGRGARRRWQLPSLSVRAEAREASNCHGQCFLVQYSTEH